MNENTKQEPRPFDGLVSDLEAMEKIEEVIANNAFLPSNSYTYHRFTGRAEGVRNAIEMLKTYIANTKPIGGSAPAYGDKQ